MLAKILSFYLTYLFSLKKKKKSVATWCRLDANTSLDINDQEVASILLSLAFTYEKLSFILKMITLQSKWRQTKYFFLRKHITVISFQNIL